MNRSDQVIRVRQADLLKILRENRDRHERVFTKALEGYRLVLFKDLEQYVKALREGRTPEVNLRWIRPQNHVRDYDRVIRMVEMHQSGDGLYELDEQHFAQYVEDDWHWRRQFISSASTYDLGATEMEYGAGAADDD